MSTSSSSPEVERLTLLLQKAADAIRVERAKYDHLRAESHSQRERIALLEEELRKERGTGISLQKGGHGGKTSSQILIEPATGAPSVPNAALRHELDSLRENNKLLGMENDLAATEIARLREENERLRNETATLLAEENRRQRQEQERARHALGQEEAIGRNGYSSYLPKGHVPAATTTSGGGGGVGVESGSRASSVPSRPRPASSAPMPSPRKERSLIVGPELNKPPQQEIPQQMSHHQQRQRSPFHRSRSSELFEKLQARSKGNASIKAVLHPTPHSSSSFGYYQASAGPSESRVSTAPTLGSTNNSNTANISASNYYNYAYDYESKREQALNRLRRSMAPPPTREQLDEVIKAMVGEMQSQLSKKGLRLPMRRVKECCYESGKKRFNLSVDSNRLMVKCGGGNVDFLEYVDRHRLCEAL